MAHKVKGRGKPGVSSSRKVARGKMNVMGRGSGAQLHKARNRKRMGNTKVISALRK